MPFPSFSIAAFWNSARNQGLHCCIDSEREKEVRIKIQNALLVKLLQAGSQAPHPKDRKDTAWESRTPTGRRKLVGHLQNVKELNFAAKIMTNSASDQSGSCKPTMFSWRGLSNQVSSAERFNCHLAKEVFHLSSNSSRIFIVVLHLYGTREDTKNGRK